MLSGDVHFAEIGRRHGLYELTSSGLTFSLANHLPFAKQILENFVPELYN